MRRFLFFCLLLALTGPDSARAASLGAFLHDGGFTLAGANTVYTVEGLILSPNHADKIENLLRAHNLRVETGASNDRYGRMPARLYGDNDQDMGVLIAQRGLGIFFSARGNDSLLQAEQQARHDKAGGWADGTYRLRSPEDVPVGRFEIVEGSVVSAATHGDNTYLNFGADYKTDFTIMIPRAVAGKFRQQKTDLLALAGKRVRVRGQVDSWNGPMIKISFPSQLEITESP